MATEPTPTPKPLAQPVLTSRPTRVVTPMTISFLNQPSTGLAFGRNDSDYHVLNRQVQIENQTVLPKLVFDQITSLVTVDLQLTEEMFVRMWKTMILKRTQDVYRIEKGIIPDDYLELDRDLIVPAPLYDLLNSLGSFISKETGDHLHLIPPNPNKKKEDFFELDLAILQTWSKDLYRCKGLYEMKNFPPISDTEDRAIGLTSRSPLNKKLPDELIIRAWTLEPKPTDALIRAVNDELFNEDTLINYKNSRYMMTKKISITESQLSYVCDYTLNSNS